MKLYKTTFEFLTAHNPIGGAATFAEEEESGAACCVTYDVNLVDSTEYEDWVEEFFQFASDKDKE